MNSQFEKYFYNQAAPCPYGKPYTALYRQAQFGCRLPAWLLADFLAAGYRRNGNTLYTMVCPHCQACQPIRVLPPAFLPNRNQRRVAKRNADLTVTIAPLAVSEEKLALCDKFLHRRYPGRGNAAQDYYSGFFINAVVDTYEVEYRQEDRLLGVAIVDLGATAMNCVYFYFDPEAGSRSLGTFDILHLLDFAEKNGIPLVYLGYWIAGLSAMSYKARFCPHQLLVAGEWREVGGGDSR